MKMASFEVQRKFLGTLYNTYGFFALYANIDGFEYSEEETEHQAKQEIDRWILSLLNSLIKKVDASYRDYEPTIAARAIQEFVNDHLSNWYVRLCRRRFWKGDYTDDKIAAYQTLYTCLNTVVKLMSPIAPFISDRIYNDLNKVTGKENWESVHLSEFPESNESLIDVPLEERMQLAQDISSMVLSLRKKESIKVRQPLNKILIPVLNDQFKDQVKLVERLIMSEVNVKGVEYITDTTGIVKKRVKPNFKVLGPKVGPNMKKIAGMINSFGAEAIAELEKTGEYPINEGDIDFSLSLEDVEIISEDIEGWLVASNEKLVVALDVNIDEKLHQEGIARELVNRIQNLRKDKGFEVTDRITIKIQEHDAINESINNNKDYICNEILATSLELVDKLDDGEKIEVEDSISTYTIIKRTDR